MKTDVYTVSCDVSLTSVPSPLDGSIVCSGAMAILNCTATNLRDNTLRWFDGTKIFASKILSEVSPSNLPVNLTTRYDIPGIRVTLNSLVSSNVNTDYESLLLVDSLIYNNSEIRSFSCGGFNDLQSNSIDLNFKVQGMNIII